MKIRIFLFFTLINISGNLKAQFSGNPGNIYYNTGNVGIGTPSGPTLYKLELNGTAPEMLKVTSTSHSIVNIGSTGVGVNPYLRLSQQGISKWSLYNNYGTDDLYFAAGDGGASNLRMILNQNGNLELRSTSHSLLNIASLNAGTNPYLRLSSGGLSKWSLYNNYGTDDLYFAAGDGGANNLRMILNQNGNLELRSTSHSILNIASLNPGVNPYLRLSSGGDAKWSLYNDYSTDALYFAASVGGASNLRMSINPNGNVGIGTGIDAPDAKLAVRGDIHTKEVRVDVIGSMVGDYVFEKDYNLISLPELETYLKQNKHLPEVPSAKEFEAEGMKLKEMNLLLLKKVEELTLYVIEQQKRITKLENQNNK